MKTIGIIQPNYIPWRGYFDFIHQVDVFVFLDDVQFTRRDWRTRNRIKLPDGKTRWLTVPAKGSRNQSINEVHIDNSQRWHRKHLEAMKHSYSRCPSFDQYEETLEHFYEPGRFDRLVDLNTEFTKQICRWLGLSPNFVFASDLNITGDREDRLIAIVKRLDGDRYLSGPAAQSYVSPELWEKAGIELQYINYDGYPEYPQNSSPFESTVTVLDLLFMVGNDAAEYIWGKHRKTDTDA